MGLPHQGKAKMTSRPLLVYRAIAAFLAHACFSRTEWSARSGFLDTSGYGGGVEEHCFNAVPGAKRKYQERFEEYQRKGGAGEPFYTHPAYEFWFLITEEGPQAALHVGGYFWVGEEGGSLSKIFNSSGRKLNYTVARAFGTLMV
jgi:hypothetical protein